MSNHQQPSEWSGRHNQKCAHTGLAYYPVVTSSYYNRIHHTSLPNLHIRLMGSSKRASLCSLGLKELDAHDDKNQSSDLAQNQLYLRILSQLVGEQR